MLRYVINGVQEGKPFSELALFMVILFAALIVSNILAQLWWNVISQKMRFRISEKINIMLFDKAAQVDLECFENPEFFDSYVKAANEGANRAFQVLNSLDRVIWCFVTISANTFLIFVIDPVLIFLSVIPLFFVFFVKRSKKHLYDRNMEVTKNDRQMKYSLRSFYLNDFAKEMRLLKMYKVMFRQFTEAYKPVSYTHLDVYKRQPS